MSEIEIKEFEWYLRDYFFRQYNQGNQEFNKEILIQGIRFYLRYRNFELRKIAALIDSAVESLSSRSVVVIKEVDVNPIRLTSGLSRLQCSKCFYISYLSSNEPMKCLRCSAMELHDFPKKKQ
ncbi:MAG: hypothetical protein WCF03_09085 [Nitrososphaeraceae archaeon]